MDERELSEESEAGKAREEAGAEYAGAGAGAEAKQSYEPLDVDLNPWQARIGISRDRILR